MVSLEIPIHKYTVIPTNLLLTIYLMRRTIEKIAGIDCILAPMQDSNSTTIQIMCRAGSHYESAKISWIAHFIEHNFFKGGERYKTPKEVAEALDKFWGSFNAWTGESEVAYFVKSAPAFTENALDVLADMMMNARFPKEELEREKGVVIQELKMYEDMPQALVAEKRQTRRYGNNNYGRSVIGTIDTIQSFTQADLFAYRNALYTKDNLIIVIAGSVDTEKIKKLIETYFTALPATKTLQKDPFTRQLPPVHQDFFEKKTEQNHLIISATGVNGRDDRRHAARVMTTILWGNMSSRLFQNIREKQGLCYYIRARHESAPEYGDFYIRAGIDKARFDFGVEKIYAEIADIANGNITEEEFHNAKTCIAGNLQMGIETSDQMVNFLGSQYLHYGEIKTLEQQLADIEKVTFDQVCEAAKMLNKENLYLYWIQ